MTQIALGVLMFTVVVLPWCSSFYLQNRDSLLPVMSPFE
jgi:hypothetical protein